MNPVTQVPLQFHIYTWDLVCNVKTFGPFFSSWPIGWLSFGVLGSNSPVSWLFCTILIPPIGDGG